MPFDLRDCRLECILGDDNIPDSPNARDKTCCWLDFIDNQFQPTENEFNMTDTKVVRLSDKENQQSDIIII